MATVAVRGDTYHLDYNDNVIDSINTSMLATLFKYLPSGPAWPRDAGTVLYTTIQVLQYEFTRLRRRVSNFLDELDPRTTFEMLPDFERIYALPDACYAPTALADRRTELQRRMRGYGDQNITTLKALVEEITAVGSGSVNTQHPLPASIVNPIRSTDLFTCVADCNDFLYGQAQMSWLQVYTFHSGYAAWESRLLCELNEAKQDHTVLEIFYGDPNTNDSRRYNPGTSTINSVCYAPELKRLVAVLGSGGTNNILYSSDFGATWSVGLSGTLANFYAVAWSPKLGMFIALSTDSLLMYKSTDGITWTLNAVTTGFTGWLDLVWAPGLNRFVAIANTRAMYSDDGINWVVTAAFTSSNLYSIVWSPKLKKLLTISGASEWCLSSNGATWTVGVDADLSSGPSDRACLAWSDYEQRFLSCRRAGDGVVVSTDGMTWTPTGAAMDTGVAQHNKIRYIESLRLWMVVGDNTSGVYANVATRISFDGLLWYGVDFVRNYFGLCEITDRAKVVMVGANEAINTTVYI